MAFADGSETAALRRDGSAQVVSALGIALKEPHVLERRQQRVALMRLERQQARRFIERQTCVWTFEEDVFQTSERNDDAGTGFHGHPPTGGSP